MLTPFLHRCLLLLSLLCPALASAVDPAEQAPDIFGRSLFGEDKHRVSDYRGKVLILDFWASWCGPCILSMPELEALKAKLVAEGLGERFEILGVNLDDDRDRAIAFLKEHPVSYPVIVDVLGLGARAYEPRKLPSAYVISPTGQIRFIYYGYGKGYGAELEQRVRLELRQADRDRGGGGVN